MILSEEETREELNKMLNWKQEHSINYTDSNLPGGFVEFFFAKVSRKEDGSWDGQAAAEFVQSLWSETK